MRVYDLLYLRVGSALGVTITVDLGAEQEARACLARTRVKVLGALVYLKRELVVAVTVVCRVSPAIFSNLVARRTGHDNLYKKSVCENAYIAEG